MEKESYLTLDNLQVYQLSRQLSKQACIVYQTLDWQMNKILGDQFVRAIDSIGANIAEGYGRYHYLDKIKFYYNARASHYEAIVHWLDLLHERYLIKEADYKVMLKISSELAPKLNSYINSTYRAKTGSQIITAAAGSRLPRPARGEAPLKRGRGQILPPHFAGSRLQ